MVNTLLSNGYAIDSAALVSLPSVPFDVGLINQLFGEFGVVHVKGVFSTYLAEKLLQRFDLLSACSDSSSTIRYGVRGHPAFEVQSQREFLDLVDCHELKGLAEMLLKRPAQRIPRTPFRSFSHGAPTTRAHADSDYLSEATSRAITMWIPLTPISLASAPLIYLMGSERHDRAALRKTLGTQHSRAITKNLSALARITGLRWATCLPTPGDVVVHGPNIVHASLDCAMPFRRVSIDVRFARADSEYDPRWSSRWSADDGY